MAKAFSDLVMVGLLRSSLSSDLSVLFDCWRSKWNYLAIRQKIILVLSWCSTRGLTCLGCSGLRQPYMIFARVARMLDGPWPDLVVVAVARSSLLTCLYYLTVGGQIEIIWQFVKILF